MSNDFPAASVQGQVAPGFEGVRSVFESNFTDGIEVGASLCVQRNGDVLVDLWGGFQDTAAKRPWQRDTLVNVYSVTKGIASLAFAAAVEAGHLNYSDEVRSIWPQLRAAETGLTVAQLLSHQAGVPGVDARLTVEDMYNWPRMIELLERQVPYWPPGSAAGYHAVHWGFLVGELIKRCTGQSLGWWVAKHIAEPLQADFYLGLPEALHGRCADLVGPNRARKRVQAGEGSAASNSAVDSAQDSPAELPALYEVALQNPSIRPWKDACSTPWRSAEIAAANGQASGGGIARIYDAAANEGAIGDIRILQAASVSALVVQEVGTEPDLILEKPLRRGRGVILNTYGEYGPVPQAFGHSGAGGALGFADPVNGLGFGYAMNQMQPGPVEETRASRLIAALYDAL